MSASRFGPAESNRQDGPSADHSHTADLAIVDAYVVTANGADGVEEAVCVTNGVISYVGSTAGARSSIGAHTVVIQAAGKTLIPGINDSHHHLSVVSLNLPPTCLGLRPEDVGTVDEICEKVRRRAASLPEGAWIIGSGWHAAMLLRGALEGREQGEVFTRQRLDEVAPNHPVALIDFSFHNVWANTKALEHAGMDVTRPTTEEYVVTDAGGLPSGLLKEAAQALIFAILPKRSPEVIELALVEGVARLNALGITSITEPGLGEGGKLFAGGTAGVDVIEAYERLAVSGRLNLRVSVLLLPAPCPQASIELGPALDEFSTRDVMKGYERRLNIVGVKIFADGVPMFRTSCFQEPYSGGDERGTLSVAGTTDAAREAELRELVRIAHARGYQVGVHATGDRTAEIATGAFIAAVESHPSHDSRHYIIHGSFATQSSLEALGRAGFGLNWSPAIHSSFAEANIEVLGATRVDRFGPVKTAREHGVRVACSSDAPIGSADWRGALASLLDRRTALGAQIGVDQKLSLIDGLRTYTTGGAWQDRAEDWKGSLEKGKVADMVLVEGNLLEMSPEQIRQMHVLRTYIEGELVYSR